VLYLKLDGEVWKLPADTKAGELRSQIADAMQSGAVIEVPVETADDPRGQAILTINGHAATQFAVLEAQDPG